MKKIIITIMFMCLLLTAGCGALQKHNTTEQDTNVVLANCCNYPPALLK